MAISLQAVIDYAARHAALVRAMAKALPDIDPNKKSLQAVADNLDAAPAGPARTFHQALQAIYIMHCALHWTVEIVPIGRLDQLLAPIYAADVKSGLKRERAQELIDCFWLKLDERVILNFRHAENRFTSSDGVLTGFFGSSNYDQGALLNQWMQQITVGGQLANDSAAPQDACNEITELCLVAARRLPLNSPTLDLRVHKGTPGPHHRARRQGAADRRRASGAAERRHHRAGARQQQLRRRSSSPTRATTPATAASRPWSRARANSASASSRRSTSSKRP